LIVVVVDPFAFPAAVACKDIPIKDRLTYQLTSAEGEALVVPWLKVLGVLDFVGDDLARATAYAWKVGQDLCARGCVDPDSGQQCATRFGLAWSEYDAPEVCFLCSMAGGLGGGEVSKSGIIESISPAARVRPLPWTAQAQCRGQTPTCATPGHNVHDDGDSGAPGEKPQPSKSPFEVAQQRAPQAEESQREQKQKQGATEEPQKVPQWIEGQGGEKEESRVQVRERVQQWWGSKAQEA
jgi:hypothetical protein